MKYIVLLGLLVAGAVAFFGVPKIRTWLKVGSESASAGIDRSLGESRVKQTEAKESIAKLERTCDELFEGKIKAEVKAEQLDRQLATLKSQKQATEESLGKLRDLIAAKEPAVLGGKTYSVGELQSTADHLIAAHKNLEEQEQGTQRTKQLLLQARGPSTVNWRRPGRPCRS